MKSTKKPITQVEARRLRKRVRELEARLQDVTSSYGRAYPGTYVGTIIADPVVSARLDTARRFGAVLVARQDGTEVHFYGAVPAVLP